MSHRLDLFGNVGCGNHYIGSVLVDGAGAAAELRKELPSLFDQWLAGSGEATDDAFIPWLCERRDCRKTDDLVINMVSLD